MQEKEVCCKDINMFYVHACECICIYYIIKFVFGLVEKCTVGVHKEHLCGGVNFYWDTSERSLFNSKGGRGILLDCIILLLLLCPAPVCVPKCTAWICICENVFMCLHECISCFGLSTYTFSSPCHLFRRAGAGAWRRAPLPSSLRMPVVSSGVLQAQRQPTDAKERGQRKTSNL